MGRRARLIRSLSSSLTPRSVMRVLLLSLLLVIIVDLHVEATLAEEDRWYWTGLNGEDCTTPVKRVCKNLKGLNYKKMKRQLRKRYCKNVVITCRCSMINQPVCDPEGNRYTNKHCAVICNGCPETTKFTECPLMPVLEF